MPIYNKLVRDNIVDIIKSEGKSAQYKVLSDSDYKNALLDKLIEEANEFKKEQNIEEFCDVLEVLEAIKNEYKFLKRNIEETKNKKAILKGKFNKKLFLISVK